MGFRIFSRHGIPSSTIQNVVTTSKTFFALDPKEKGKVARPRPEIVRGYGGMESEGLAYSQDEETPPDLKEVFDVGPTDVPDIEYYRGVAAGVHFPHNPWPSNTPQFRGRYTAYFDRMSRL